MAFKHERLSNKVGQGTLSQGGRLTRHMFPHPLNPHEHRDPASTPGTAPCWCHQAAGMSQGLSHKSPGQGVPASIEGWYRDPTAGLPLSSLAGQPRLTHPKKRLDLLLPSSPLPRV